MDYPEAARELKAALRLRTEPIGAHRPLAISPTTRTEATVEFRPMVRRILEERYLRRNPEGEVIETPEELFWRVARSVAAGHPGGTLTKPFS
jgi:ribonucleotide reductase alpha subunit